MKDRLVTVAGGLLALTLMVILLVPVPDQAPGEVSRPLSADRGRQGLQGLERWLTAGGVATEVLGRRYTELGAGAEGVPTGNLLVVSLPQRTPSRPRERAALREWLARGNSILVLAAAGDVPRWSTLSDSDSTRRFLQGLGFELDMSGDSSGGGHGDSPEERSAATMAALASQISGEPVSLEPRTPHPVTRGVDRVAARSVRPLDLGWQLRGHDAQRAVLGLLAEPGAQTALWEARVGDGRMWLSRYADIFGNVSLGEADNARLLANMIAIAVGPNGRVIFDDMHQGVTDLYNPEAFFRDPRLLATLGFIMAFWVFYLVGSSQRLALPRARATRYYAADLARAMAGLLVRRIDPVTLARQLFAHFFDDIRRRYGLPTNGEPVWTLLLGMARVARADVREMETLYGRAAAGSKVDPVALARLMQRTRDSLS